MQAIGVLCALVALFSWALGDFYIQKTVRAVGIWKARFFMSVLGVVVLSPFAIPEISRVPLYPADFALLAFASFIAVVAGMSNLEALHEGKFSVIEPLMGLELPIVVGLSVFFRNEALDVTSVALMAVVFVGIILTISTGRRRIARIAQVFEKGALIGIVGAIGLALTTFMVGSTSQDITPIATLWFMNIVVAVVSVIYLTIRKEIGPLWKDLRIHKRIIAFQSILDNIAWLAFAFAVSFIPISIAAGISEGYIALGVVFGVYVNHEKLKRHQIVGVCLAVAGAIALSVLNAA